MNLLNRLHQHFTLLIVSALLCVSQIASATDLADATKLFKQENYSQALDKVNSLLTQNPKDAQARFLKGLIFTEQSKTNEAIKVFSALTEDYPELPEPYNNLAVLYASQGQYEKAKLSLEMAIRTNPSYETAHENLGDIYAKMASQAYDRALKLGHGNTATQTKLAMIQNLFGDGVLAKESTSLVSKATSKLDTAAATEKLPAATPATTIATTTNKVATAAPGSPPAPDQSKEVLKTVQAWAAAWSAQDANKYLSFYAEDFKTPGQESRASWEATRRERIAKPKSIQVAISNATVQFSGGTHATVDFRQSYRSNHLSATSKKVLFMVKSNGKWLIREEQSK